MVFLSRLTFNAMQCHCAYQIFATRRWLVLQAEGVVRLRPSAVAACADFRRPIVVCDVGRARSMQAVFPGFLFASCLWFSSREGAPPSLRVLFRVLVSLSSCLSCDHATVWYKNQQRCVQCVVFGQVAFSLLLLYQGSSRAVAIWIRFAPAP